MELSTTANGIEQLGTNHTSPDEWHILIIGILFILSILYFAFFLFDKTKTINLYFSLYTISQSAFWFFFVHHFRLNQVEWLFWSGILEVTILVAGFLFFLRATYRLFEQRLGLFYWGTILLGISNIFLDTFYYGWGGSISILIFTNVFNIGVILIAFKAAKSNKRGAWIIVRRNFGILKLGS